MASQPVPVKAISSPTAAERYAMGLLRPVDEALGALNDAGPLQLPARARDVAYQMRATMAALAARIAELEGRLSDP